MRIVLSCGYIAVFFVMEGIYPLFAGRTRRLEHAAPNIGLSLINALIAHVLLAALTAATLSWSAAQAGGLLRLARVSGIGGGLLAFILFDLWMYCWHRANHQIAFLWRFHRVHHVDTAMDCTTALRFHPLEIVFSSLLRLPVLLAIGMDARHILYYEMILQPIILFHHSNIGLPERWDRILRAVIVTPNMHRVHHSHRRRETDSNYASVFSVWDRLFSSFNRRDDIRGIVFGLEKYREVRWMRLDNALMLPFEQRAAKQ